MEKILQNWDETKLWRQLEKSTQPETDEVCTTIKQLLPDIQKLLLFAGTSPKDFTLHDSQHAFRVAERIAVLTPQDTFSKLSPYEIALLLLSAYLHDIGMSPPQSKLDMLNLYIISGDEKKLPANELKKFQEWLINWDNNFTIPASSNVPNWESFSRLNLLVAHYCRYRHVAWGEEWIDCNIIERRLGTYAQWIEDLKLLCKSHHQGYQDLISRIFDPKPVGSNGLIVHLRYLAILLRVADILEFDPERTPEIIFAHRNISPQSVIYWHKDHNITPILENGRLTISAEPSNAYFHKAIETMVDEIENELLLARRIDDELPFEIPQFQETVLYHKWHIHATVRRRINPRANSYEYIDGAFRPNTQKILQLLSGIELYGNELAAVRELLQNSFDAVRELIAYERLQKRDPSNPKWEEMLGEYHEVELILEIDEGGNAWLICNDDGVGMTRAIIRDYLLVSGITQPPDVRSLESRCRLAGFELNKTGQFGIGVLSYFMVARYIQIQTRRSSLCGDSDPCGWIFETEGVGAFGELKCENSQIQGTKVRLLIRPEIVCKEDESEAEKKAFDKYLRRYFKLRLDDLTQLEKLFYRIRRYLENIVFHIPCNFEFSTKISNCYPLKFKKGWTHNSDDLTNFHSEIIDFLRLDDDNLLPSHIMLDRKKSIERVSSVHQNLLRWETLSGALPDDLGDFRIHIPIFNFPQGQSFFFLDILNNELIINNMSPRWYQKIYLFRPEDKIYATWKGIYISLDLDLEIRSRYGIVEINFKNKNAGTLSVSRTGFKLSSKGYNAIAWLFIYLEKTVYEIACANNISIFSALNFGLIHSIYSNLSEEEIKLRARIQEIRREYDKFDFDPFWIFQRFDENNNSVNSFEKVHFPVIAPVSRNLFERTPNYSLMQWKNNKVRPLYLTKLNWTEDKNGWSKYENSNHWIEILSPPHKMVRVKDKSNFLVMGLWLHKDISDSRKYIKGGISEFPNVWKNLCGIYIQNYNKIIWNSTHFICKVTDVEVIKWAECEISSTKFPQYKKDSDRIFDPRLYKDAILSNKENAIAWMVYAFDGLTYYGWEALTEQAQELLKKIWQLIFNGDEKYPLYFLNYTFYGCHLAIITPTSYQRIYDTKAIEKFLPDPGEEWTVEILDSHNIVDFY